MKIKNENNAGRGLVQFSSNELSHTQIPPGLTFKIKDKNIFFTFPYNEEAKTMIKGCPDGRRWMERLKQWRVPVTIDNLKYLNNNGFDFDVSVLEQGLKIDPDLKILEPKTKPFKHQTHGLKLCLSNKEVFLMWEMGTGKSWIGVNKVRHFLDKKILIICPKTVLSSWENEFKKHSDLTPVVVKGSKKKRIEILENNNICLMNYDLLISLEELLLSINFEFIILDESHFIKNQSAKRSKIVHKLCKKIEHKLLLTGTPITQGPADIFSQYLALDGGTTFGVSFYAFRGKYYIDKGYGFPDWQLRDGVIGEIKDKMFLKGHRLKKTDCFDLPPKNYQKIDVEMATEQARIYRELEKEMYTLIGDEEITIQYLLSKLIKLNQVTSGFLYTTTDEVRKTIRFNHNKLKVLGELIGDKPKAVVWCLFREDMEAITKAYGGVGTDQWEDFQNDPSIRLMVGQVHAGGIGITLTAASFVVYYSQGYSLSDRLQSEDRTHRIGTTGTVTYVDLVCRRTIDEDILKILEAKRTVAGYITGDIGTDLIQKMREE
ncbi:MAG: DEAD/DEAH box helicase [Deltaproteobacteria bacterium]|nr:DEAD/DEAH box helicase [Deltaproteobacteria bacterium]